MTCIVGIVQNGRIVMGGDSAAVGGYALTRRRDPKVFRLSDRMLIGYTSSFRMGQLLRFRLSLPKHHSDIPTYDWLATEFVDAVRACFKQYGWLQQDDGRDEGGRFLVGYQGGLYSVQGDFQIEEALLPYAAVGCGDDIAQGALYGLLAAQVDLPPETMIEHALAAAEEFSAGVRRPWTIETLPSTAEA